MTFSTQADAKRFFVDQVLAQASVEGIRLSEAERHMLSWSESDPDFTPDARQAEAQQAEIPEDQYELKIAGLIQRGYARSVASDRPLKQRYRSAYAKLSEGDHYILVMIERGLGRRVKRWWPF
jgi:hypothetical protein